LPREENRAESPRAASLRALTKPDRNRYHSRQQAITIKLPCMGMHITRTHIGVAASRRNFLQFLLGSPLLAATASDEPVQDPKAALSVMDFEAAARADKLIEIEPYGVRSWACLCGVSASRVGTPLVRGR